MHLDAYGGVGLLPSANLTLRNPLQNGQRTDGHLTPLFTQLLEALSPGTAGFINLRHSATAQDYARASIALGSYLALLCCTWLATSGTVQRSRVNRYP